MANGSLDKYLKVRILSYTVISCLFVNSFRVNWKLQKTRGFPTFSEGIEMEHWFEMGYVWLKRFSSFFVFFAILLISLILPHPAVWKKQIFHFQEHHSKLSIHQLLGMARGVASGMKYLSDLGYIHRVFNTFFVTHFFVMLVQFWCAIWV